MPVRDHVPPTWYEDFCTELPNVFWRQFLTDAGCTDLRFYAGPDDTEY